jgi:uncharacterized membrane protein YphA (DoxX/SURF4 family)
MTTANSSANSSNTSGHSLVSTISRVALGLIFTVFGLNGFFHFLPQPPLEGTALQFIGGLAAAGYFFPLLKGTEVLAGLLLLSGRYVPLALTVLAPISINIFAFHAFVAGGGMALPIVILALQLYLAWHNRAAYRGVLEAKAPAANRANEASSRPSYAH